MLRRRGASAASSPVWEMLALYILGVIPTELGNLGLLSEFEFGNNAAPKLIWRRRRKQLTGGPREGEGLNSWKARMRLEQGTKQQALKGDKEEDAPAPPTSPPPVLLPQQQHIEEGDQKEEDAPVPSPATPPSLLPHQQEEAEDDEKQEDYQVPTGSTPPALLPQQQEEGEGDGKQEDYEVPICSTPPVLLPQQQEEGEGDEKEEGAPEPSPSTPPALLPQEQQIDEGDDIEEDAPVPLGSPNQREEIVGERVRSPDHTSLSPEEAAKVDRVFTAQLSSSAGLDSLIRENPIALEDIQRVLKSTDAGRFYPDDERSDMERRRKLGTLVTMSNALGEVALRHTEDMDIQRKELALPPFSEEYYTAIRTGLCEAYLAASVIDSDWVSTRKTGSMGKAGVALKLMSSAVPVIGGLTGLAGKALETGDHFVQTRRLVKITAMAPDAVECCSLARRLALQLTDGLRNDDAGATANDTDQVRVHTTAGTKGVSGHGRGADMLPDIMSEEYVFEYVLEEVASHEGNNHEDRSCLLRGFIRGGYE